MYQHFFMSLETRQRICSIFKDSFLDKSRVVWLIRTRCSFIHFSSYFTSGVLVIPLQRDFSSSNFITAHTGILWFISRPDEMQKLPLCWEIKNRISYPFQFVELRWTLSVLLGYLLKPKEWEFWKCDIKIWIPALKVINCVGLEVP